MVNWRIKSLAFRMMEATQALDGFYRLGRRLVSRNYLPNLTARSLKSYMIPVTAFSEIEGARTAFEFGAGRGLITPILLHQAGAELIYACDLKRLASIEQINTVITQLADLGHGDGRTIENFDQLRSRYGIEYRAPSDARRCPDITSGSVDLIYSTATLEHIPKEQIRELLAEMRRLLQPNGRLCFTIDYHDHYASSDRSIGYFNFYKYGEDEWSRYNSALHFQNRLRHSDYVALFEEAGLHVHMERAIYDDWSERDFERATLHPRFEKYSREDLTASNGLFLLGRA